MLFEKQQYQENCVDNIVSVLKKSQNLTDLSSLKDNLTALQQEKRIIVRDTSPNKNLDILMETGTGKTFTYIKTMYQLDKEYGINKFIIFVPRLAIREGVIQNINLTSDYFFQIFGKRLKKYSYGGKAGINQVSSFIRDKNELSVLVLTSASISANNEANRILARRYEGMDFDDKSPLHAISKLNPVTFIDEPHLLKGDKFVKAYEKYFKQSLCIRFGATFPTEDTHKLSNVVYVLDSLSAFRDHLVKKIRVTTVINNEDTGIRFLKSEKPHIKISYFKENIEYSKLIKIATDLGAVTDNSNYNGISIVKVTANKIYLSDHTAVEIAKNDYRLDVQAIRPMIKRTIEIHFEKEEDLFKQGIKTLSLFFIPNVGDFRGDNPCIKQIFEEEYKTQRDTTLAKNLAPGYKEYLQKDYNENGKLCVHDGYFSGDKGNSEQKESEGVNLILKDKENLLSTQTPLRFIFSVWALQEGWDNPNIFNICKLASSTKETSRRQQVGRGLRLAVNNYGKRQTIKHCEDNENRFYNINMLDVIVSGQEKNFIEEIQSEINSNSYGFVGDRLTIEILKQQNFDDREASRLLTYLEDNAIIKFSKDEDAYHVQSPIADFLRSDAGNFPEPIKDRYEDILIFFASNKQSPIINRNKPSRKIGIRPTLFKEFESLWHEITRKAKITYQNIDDAALINKIANGFNNEHIDPIKVISKTQTYNHETDEVEHNHTETIGDVTFFKNKSAYGSFIKDFAKAKKLPLSFMIKLFNKLDKEKISNNPKKAVALLEKITKDTIHSSIIQNVGYQFNGDIKIEANESRKFFYDDHGIPLSKIEASKIGRYYDNAIPPQHYLYDAIIYDSDIEKIAIKTDPKKVDNQKITVFAKLPYILIPTPYKNNNPDFAYYIENNKGGKLFLIVETKGYDSESEIPDNEKIKIDYAEKFFEQLNQDMQANNRDTKIIFKKRINKQDFLSLLEEIGSDQR